MNKSTLVGIDTAKRVFHVVAVNRAGAVVWRRQLRRSQLLARLATLPRCEVVLEACAASQHWARRINELGHRAQLIAPQHVTPLDTFREHWKAVKLFYVDSQGAIASHTRRRSPRSGRPPRC